MMNKITNGRGGAGENVMSSKTGLSVRPHRPGSIKKKCGGNDEVCKIALSQNKKNRGGRGRRV